MLSEQNKFKYLKFKKDNSTEGKLDSLAFIR